MLTTDPETLRDAALSGMPRGARLVCYGSKSAPGRWQPAPLAVAEPYVGVHLCGRVSMLAIDADHETAADPEAGRIADADLPPRLSWEAAGLPPPTWIAERPDCPHRAHLVWRLRHPVAPEGKEYRLLRGVRRAMTTALAADPAYSGHRTKAPLSDLHRTLAETRAPLAGYLLDELAECAPPVFGTSATDAPAGQGRNAWLFDELRNRCWQMARDAADDRDFARIVYAEAAGLNLELNSPLAAAEVRSVAKSVASGIWVRHLPKRQAFYARQAARSRIGNAARTRVAVGREAQVIALRESGLTWAAIADALGVTAGAARQLHIRASRREGCTDPKFQGTTA